MASESTMADSQNWKLKRYPTIMSGVVYRWTLGRAEVNASRDGISICGYWATMSNVSGLIHVLNDAEWAARQLASNRDFDPPNINGREVLRPVFGEKDDE
jgi:hypothetical protein